MFTIINDHKKLNSWIISKIIKSLWYKTQLSAIYLQISIKSTYIRRLFDFATLMPLNMLTFTAGFNFKILSKFCKVSFILVAPENEQLRLELVTVYNYLAIKNLLHLTSLCLFVSTTITTISPLVTKLHYPSYHACLWKTIPGERKIIGIIIKI
jgi:hypothetical protein